MRITIATLLSLCALTLAPAARADDDHPCKADVERLCPNLPQERGAIFHCLQEHQADLSAACKAKHESFKEHRGELRKEMSKVREACKADEQKFCGDVKPGGGAIIACMKSHEKDLSKACTDAQAEARAKHDGHKAPPPATPPPAAPPKKG
ncbi:MAG: hypothetical protein JST92_14620 [Deltaproteobacteria bacterium]|nr:hypothetical protein [Deltaproteobacteria bacterium]